MPTSKRNILYFRCSDGRSRRPDDIKEHCVHQIRVPGGILFPELCAAEFKRRIVKKLMRKVTQFAVEIMIKLKQPDEVILASHGDCGAAKAIGFDTQAVQNAHLLWARRLRIQFPHITIRVLHEEHSVCGTEHHGHTVVADPDEQMAA